MVLPYRLKVSIAVAVAIALPGPIVALLGYKSASIAEVLALLFIGALCLAYRWYKKTVFCDTKLILSFPDPVLSNAVSGIPERPWLTVNNLGKDDAFTVAIQIIENCGISAGFHKIPFVSYGSPEAAIPMVVRDGRVEPVMSSHPGRFVELLESGRLDLETNFNHLTSVRIEFRDKDEFRYVSHNTIDFHKTQKKVTVFYQRTERL